MKQLGAAEQAPQLAVADPGRLLFGVAPLPLTTRQGLVLGGGQVYPELNFTLPPMEITAETMPDVRERYRRLGRQALDRAAALDAPGLVLELETLPPMTQHPEWGEELARILLEQIETAHQRTGLKATLRVTPNDLREFVRPPVMRSGPYWESMLALFERAAAAGAELLSIESVGGKELHDEALTLGDLPQALFALCVLGVRDMQFLWTQIKAIADQHGVWAAGDTACGFANTAMVLAEQRMIPRVFAAVIRAVSAVRSLAAYQCGAVGPGKDCGYENIILKAITGRPMAMEGKTAACAHLSPVGNVAAAACDTWSNESVQDVMLLAAPAPICMLESLVYDCRLMNEALADGEQAALQLRQWLVRSDVVRDPQALVLAPETAVELAGAIVRADDPYQAGRAAARRTIELIRQAAGEGRLRLLDRERPWLDRMEKALDRLPDDQDAFIEQQLAAADRSKFSPKEYGL